MTLSRVLKPNNNNVMKILEIIFALFLASIIIGAIIDNVTIVLVSSLAMIVIVVIAIWKKR